MKKTSLILMSAFMLFSLSIMAQGTKNVTTKTSTSTKSINEDEDFIKKATSGGMMEVEAGKVAQQKSTSPQVREFAQMMVKDHSDANDKLKAVLKKINLTAPTTLEKKDQNHIDKLTGKTGKDFDEEYMNMMVDDHKKDVDEFEKAEKKINNPELKQWISSTLPVLRKHLSSAQSIYDQLKKNK